MWTGYHSRYLILSLSFFVGEGDALSPDNPVVVYGDCIEAYCCMAALLELGIISWEIVFVEPFPSNDPNKMRVNWFNDETVNNIYFFNLGDYIVLWYCIY